MPFAIQARIEGVAEVLKALDGVDAKLRKKGVRAAVSKGGQVILSRARKTAPKQTGLLKKSLGKKVKVYRHSGNAVAVVGPRTGFRGVVTRDGRQVTGDPTKYAHLVELGTVRAKAKPFLRPAIEQQKKAILDAMASAVRKVLGTTGG